MVDDQVGGIAGHTVTGADLDTPLVGGSDQGEDEQENAVLLVLGMNPESDILKVQRWVVGLLELSVESEQPPLLYARRCLVLKPTHEGREQTIQESGSWILTHVSPQKGPGWVPPVGLFLFKAAAAGRRLVSWQSHIT
jgi:hypothetical protein